MVKVETLSCHKAPKDMMSHTDTACEREGLCAGLPGLAVLQCPSQCVLGPEGVVEKTLRTTVSDSCDPMDCSPPGSFVHEIFQARISRGEAKDSALLSSRDTGLL